MLFMAQEDVVRQVFCKRALGLGFLQGFAFMVSSAQECPWDDLGSLEPVVAFLAEMLEHMLRLHGPAGPPAEYGLDPSAVAPMRTLYDFFDAQKSDRGYHKDVSEYMSKAAQWLGSDAYLAHLDEQAYAYALWLRQNPDHSSAAAQQ